MDGFFGPHTETAVLSFQQDRGLLADGRVGANTWRELVESGYALGDRLLYLREPPFRGDDVLQLQVKLNLLGFNAGPERGVHDEEVERAVLDFQRNAGLPVDGIVGESTLRKLEAVRKAESGREGKKIPERDRGYAAALGLTGQSVTIDPGHGGPDLGVVSPRGLAEKDVTLALGLRLAELLRAEGCRVQLTREADERVPLYARADAAGGTATDFFLSLHCNDAPSPAARGGASYYFQRSHYYSEHGRRLAGSIGARMERAGVPWLGRFGRNYALLREARGIALVVEPLFLIESRGRSAGAAARARGEAGARAGRRVRRLPRARPARARGGVVTPDEAAALRIRLTATQSQRLRELGADPLVLDELFADAPARDAAFKRLEGELVKDGRRRLKELRNGRRAPQLVELERVLATRSPTPGSCRSSRRSSSPPTRCARWASSTATRCATRCSGSRTAAACGPCWRRTCTPCSGAWTATGASRSASSRSAPASAATARARATSTSSRCSTWSSSAGPRARAARGSSSSRPWSCARPASRTTSSR